MSMLKTLALALALMSAGVARSAGPDYSLDGLRLPAAHVQIVMKPGYAYVMADLFPLRAELKGDAGRLSRVAQALADGPVLERFPDAQSVKLALVELPEKDDYGSPLWSSVKVLARFQGDRKGSAFVIAAEKAKAKRGAKGAAKPAAAKQAKP